MLAADTYLLITVDGIDKAGNGMVDLKYALSIYDEFAEKYVEEAGENEKIVEDNPAEVEVYEEAEVEASWRNRDHYATVINSGTDIGIDNTELMIIGLGAKAPDLCIKQDGDGETKTFHGFGNYVAHYMYVMRLAQSCYTDGLSTAFKNVKHPLGDTQRDRMKAYLQKFFDKNETSNYTSLITNSSGQYIYADNKKTKALLLVGIATHLASDVYAHRAYYYDTNQKQWVIIPKIMQVVDGKEVSIRDITTVIPNRWETAENVVCDILSVWSSGASPDACEFYQPGIHNKDSFRLYKFKTWVAAADPNSYAIMTNWINNRSAAD